MKIKLTLLLLTLLFLTPPLCSQNIIEVKPLFEYPVAPEEIEGLNERCDYLVKHFWDNFDFKSKQPVDQYALNEAFGVFTTSLQFASKKEADLALEKINGKLASNPILALQFTKAAEEKLYGPRAEIWIDDIYIKFLESLIKNKKIKQERKNKYVKQYEALTNSAVSSNAPSFEFIGKDDEKKSYFPMSTPTILIFGNPDDSDWMMDRLKMESNLNFKEALEKGKINVLYIINHNIDNWQQKVNNYNPRWTIGKENGIENLYDTRLNPSIYVVGADGKILKKFASVNEAVSTTMQLTN